jgi:hypothetical protein
MTPEEMLARIRTNEGNMKSITFGSYGVCAACYVLALSTRHHVKPRSVAATARDWKPFTIMLCRKCHAVIHQMESNQNLYLKHKTLDDVIQAIRLARAIPSTLDPRHSTPPAGYPPTSPI